MAKTYYTGALLLFHWKSFAVTNRSAKNVKLFHLKRFTTYGITRNMYVHVIPFYLKMRTGFSSYVLYNISTSYNTGLFGFVTNC